MSNKTVTTEELNEMPDNAVVYSEAAWAVARKGVGTSDWFTDAGASSRSRHSAAQLVEWTSQWERLR